MARDQEQQVTGRDVVVATLVSLVLFPLLMVSWVIRQMGTQGESASGAFRDGWVMIAIVTGLITAGTLGLSLYYWRSGRAPDLSE